MKKCVITVVGKDTVGIIAKVCSYLADNRINSRQIHMMMSFLILIILVMKSGLQLNASVKKFLI